jgi:hypothetical protein
MKSTGNDRERDTEKIKITTFGGYRGRSPVTGDFFPGHQAVPCALGSTQPLKMSTRILLEGKGGRCVRVTTLPPSCVDCLEILEP